jgi:hypothetical protein
MVTSKAGEGGRLIVEELWRRREALVRVGQHTVDAYTQASIDKMAPTFFRVRRWADDTYKA